MKSKWTSRTPEEPGWYFFRCDSYAEQLAWVYHSSGKWYAVIRHNISLNIEEFSDAEFDGPLAELEHVVDREPAGTMESLMAELGVIDGKLQSIRGRTDVRICNLHEIRL